MSKQKQTLSDILLCPPMVIAFNALPALLMHSVPTGREERIKGKWHEVFQAAVGIRFCLDVDIAWLAPDAYVVVCAYQNPGLKQCSLLIRPALPKHHPTGDEIQVKHSALFINGLQVWPILIEETLPHRAQ